MWLTFIICFLLLQWTSTFYSLRRGRSNPFKNAQNTWTTKPFRGWNRQFHSCGLNRMSVSMSDCPAGKMEFMNVGKTSTPSCTRPGWVKPLGELQEKLRYNFSTTNYYSCFNFNLLGPPQLSTNYIGNRHTVVCTVLYNYYDQGAVFKPSMRNEEIK